MVRKLASIPYTASVILSCIALVIIFGYALFVAFPALVGPSLSVEARAASGITTVLGSVERVSYLYINGLEIPLEEDGTFKITRAYPPGYTDIHVIARDRFGRVLTRSIGIVTKSP